jgi:ketosteroid isomerase-like protein
LRWLHCFCSLNRKETREVEVQKTLTGFIQAFDNLEWDKFRAFFADDATVFYPRQFPERAQGRTEYENGFRKVFEQIRGGRTKPPYMEIQPRRATHPVRR